MTGPQIPPPPPPVNMQPAKKPQRRGKKEFTADDIEKKIAQLDKRIAELRSQDSNESNRQILARLETELREYRQQLTAMNQPEHPEITQAKQDAAEFKAQIEECESLIREKEQLDADAPQSGMTLAELTEMLNDFKKLQKSKYDRASKEFNQANTSVRELEKELSNLVLNTNNELAKLRGRVTELSQEKAGIEANLNRVGSALKKRNQARCEEIASLIQQHEAQIEELTDPNSATENVIKDLKQEIEDLHATRAVKKQVREILEPENKVKQKLAGRKNAGGQGFRLGVANEDWLNYLSYSQYANLEAFIRTPEQNYLASLNASQIGKPPKELIRRISSIMELSDKLTKTVLLDIANDQFNLPAPGVVFNKPSDLANYCTATDPESNKLLNSNPEVPTKMPLEFYDAEHKLVITYIELRKQIDKLSNLMAEIGDISQDLQSAKEQNVELDPSKLDQLIKAQKQSTSILASIEEIAAIKLEFSQDGHSWPMKRFIQSSDDNPHEDDMFNFHQQNIADFNEMLSSEPFKNIEQMLQSDRDKKATPVIGTADSRSVPSSQNLAEIAARVSNRMSIRRSARLSMNSISLDTGAAKAHADAVVKAIASTPALSKPKQTSKKAATSNEGAVGNYQFYVNAVNISRKHFKKRKKDFPHLKVRRDVFAKQPELYQEYAMQLLKDIGTRQATRFSDFRQKNAKNKGSSWTDKIRQQIAKTKLPSGIGLKRNYQHYRARLEAAAFKKSQAKPKSKFNNIEANYALQLLIDAANGRTATDFELFQQAHEQAIAKASELGKKTNRPVIEIYQSILDQLGAFTQSSSNLNLEQANVEAVKFSPSASVATAKPKPKAANQSNKAKIDLIRKCNSELRTELKQSLSQKNVSSKQAALVVKACAELEQICNNMNRAGQAIDLQQILEGNSDSKFQLSTQNKEVLLGSSTFQAMQEEISKLSLRVGNN